MAELVFSKTHRTRAHFVANVAFLIVWQNVVEFGVFVQLNSVLHHVLAVRTNKLLFVVAGDVVVAVECCGCCCVVASSLLLFL